MGESRRTADGFIAEPNPNNHPSRGEASHHWLGLGPQTAQLSHATQERTSEAPRGVIARQRHLAMQGRSRHHSACPGRGGQLRLNRPDQRATRMFHVKRKIVSREGAVMPCPSCTVTASRETHRESRTDPRKPQHRLEPRGEQRTRWPNRMAKPSIRSALPLYTTRSPPPAHHKPRHTCPPQYG